MITDLKNGISLFRNSNLNPFKITPDLYGLTMQKNSPAQFS